VHNNYYFLRQISARLREQLDGFTLVSCFSQNRDEIVFEFNNAKRSFFIKADLQGDFSCLTFPRGFNRARKNSIDLFNETILKKVTGVRQFENERSFMIGLEGDLAVLFKMHGNRSNVLLMSGGQATDMFKKKLENDLSIVSGDLDKEIDWSKEAFARNIEQPEKLYFTFGKPVWVYLKSKGFYEADTETKWSLIHETLQILNEPQKFFIVDYNNGLHLSLLPFATIEAEYDDPFIAVNDFVPRRASRSKVDRHIEQMQSHARKEIKATRNYLETARERLAEIENDEHYKAWADILMANLHRIEAGAKSVQLENFYHDNDLVDIPLDKSLSPQKNAERYYRKSKNQVIEVDKLRESISKYEIKLGVAEAALQDLNAPMNDDEVRSLIEQNEEESQQSEKETIPFWQFEYKGFTIWAGKDAKNNDELTMRWAHKNDLWLHARDVAGSHVIIRHKAGKPFPKEVIEYAASIAAFNSKRKTESLAPVMVTPRKFVRKRKGDPVGAVVVEKEDVVLVEPRNPLV
jgi:predicted ribosome quality control (RQC) complex YloA/Tae2 family protein